MSEPIELSQTARRQIEELLTRWTQGDLAIDEVRTEVARIIVAEAWRLAEEEDERELLYGDGSPLPPGLANAAKGIREKSL